MQFYISAVECLQTEKHFFALQLFRNPSKSQTEDFTMKARSVIELNHAYEKRSVFSIIRRDLDAV